MRANARRGFLAFALAALVVLGGAALADESNAPAASENGQPVCVRVGTRSEGWAWPSGRFIHWAKCKGVVPKCHAAGAGHDVEGWYAGVTLIAPARCTASARKHR